jgi:hypothetical protein
MIPPFRETAHLNGCRLVYCRKEWKGKQSEFAVYRENSTKEKAKIDTTRSLLKMFLPDC